jgi:SLT domain-containing protein
MAIAAPANRVSPPKTKAVRTLTPAMQVPPAVQSALREALKIEGVRADQFDDFLWIVAHESGGRVDVRNSRSSARGLFQLLSAQYPLNPNGVASFGNAVDECQGGIRYVIRRYRSASAARKFWEKHQWY